MLRSNCHPHTFLRIKVGYNAHYQRFGALSYFGLFANTGIERIFVLSAARTRIKIDTILPCCYAANFTILSAVLSFCYTYHFISRSVALLHLPFYQPYCHVVYFIICFGHTAYTSNFTIVLQPHCHGAKYHFIRHTAPMLLTLSFYQPCW